MTISPRSSTPPAARSSRLEQERDAALLTRSRFLAEFARQQNEVSDFGTALALGLEAIPDPSGAIGDVIASEAVIELDRAVRSLRERRVLRGHEGGVTSAVFDPSGARVLTASATVRHGCGMPRAAPSWPCYAAMRAGSRARCSTRPGRAC